MYMGTPIPRGRIQKDAGREIYPNYARITL